MGIGIVLVVWAIVLAVLAMPAVLVLLVASYCSGGLARLKRVAVWAFVAIPSGGFYALAAFIGYAVWCDVVRGVDPGLGDAWYVPIGSRHELLFVDTLDNVSIVPCEGIQGEGPIAGILRIARVGDYVFGITRDDGAFLIEGRAGKVSRNLSSVELSERLPSLSLPDISLETPREFYVRCRWGWSDLAAAFLLGGPACILIFKTFGKAWAADSPCRRGEFSSTKDGVGR